MLYNGSHGRAGELWAERSTVQIPLWLHVLLQVHIEITSRGCIQTQCGPTNMKEEGSQSFAKVPQNSLEKVIKIIYSLIQ